MNQVITAAERGIPWMEAVALAVWETERESMADYLRRMVQSGQTIGFTNFQRNLDRSGAGKVDAEQLEADEAEEMSRAGAEQIDLALEMIGPELDRETRVREFRSRAKVTWEDQESDLDDKTETLLEALTEVLSIDTDSL